MEKNDQREFAEFMATAPMSVPASVTEKIFAAVKEDLNPSAWQVFAKTAFIHFISGTISLLICPQFGLSLTESAGLMPYFMHFGHTGCMLICGFIFTSLSLLISAVSLRPEEVRTLRKHKLLQVSTLSLLSLGAFLCLGSEVVTTLGLIWLIGATVGGALTLELGWAIRYKLAKQGAL